MAETIRGRPGRLPYARLPIRSLAICPAGGTCGTGPAGGTIFLRHRTNERNAAAAAAMVRPPGRGGSVYMLFLLFWRLLDAPSGHSGFDALSVVGRRILALDAFFHHLHHRHFECNYGSGEFPLTAGSAPSTTVRGQPPENARGGGARRRRGNSPTAPPSAVLFRFEGQPLQVTILESVCALTGIQLMRRPTAWRGIVNTLTFRLNPFVAAGCFASGANTPPLPAVHPI